MLRFLEIKNLAVIEAATIEFEPGLNVLTGETGAGKSILVEAVGLLLGGRASPDLVRTGEDTAVLQAVFEDGRTGEELLLRREITSQGRSRGFVNGALATAGSLRELASRLVDLHGQHEHQALLDPDTHLDFLDRFGHLDVPRSRVAAAFDELVAARQALAEVRTADSQRTSRMDLVEYQLAELDRASLQAGEDESLEAQRALLSNAERLRRLCDESYSLLYDRDDAVLAGLGQVWRRVGELAALDPRFGPFIDARDGIKSQLEDLAEFLRTYSRSIDATPDRLQQVEDRLAVLQRLKRKYGPTLADVLGTHARLQAERAGFESLADRLAGADRQEREASARYLQEAADLGAARRAAAGRLGPALVGQLSALAMEHTRFEVRFNRDPTPPDRWTSRGIDTAEFFVSPNPGEELRPLARVVSGGELSRIMLSIKSLASIDEPGKTLVFDEVDAGIGGRVAGAVGARLEGLGREFQVLCITHLPQIAARGGAHYLIEKRVLNGRTITTVRRLTGNQREEELARMLGGARVTDAARSSARELLAEREGESDKRAKGERRKSAQRIDPHR